MHGIASSTWDDREIQAIERVIESGMFTMGDKVREAEEAYAEYVGTKHAVMVNSGSSANLLMVAAYALEHSNRSVIVPALAWSTSYSPLQQYGFHLKFVDIDPDTFNYDIKALNKAYQAGDLILAVNMMGTPNDFDRFPAGRPQILEDNCESMGATYNGKKTGCFGAMASHSTFFSHHICTMEGGFVTTDDDVYRDLLLALRSHGWTRHLAEQNSFARVPSAYEFVVPGYNVRPIEMMGALAVEQIRKLPDILEGRTANARSFPGELPKVPDNGVSSYFCFPIIDENIERIKREFDAKGVEHRPIMSGNFTRQPAIKYYDFEKCGSLANADYVATNGIYIGNSHLTIDWSFMGQKREVA